MQIKISKQFFSSVQFCADLAIDTSGSFDFFKIKMGPPWLGQVEKPEFQPL